MKYLFFDIECADGGKSTICSFGYVVADMQFRVIEREDIVINPEGRFYLTGRSGRPDVKLAYPKHVFRAAPNFPHFYERIKTLLEYEDYYVIGHAVTNDVKYLNHACKRYNLPPLAFTYFDTQKMFKNVFKKNAPSLQNQMEQLGIDASLHFHRSEDDAYATMRILEVLLERYGHSFADYLAANPNHIGKTENFRWGWNGVDLTQQTKHHTHRANGLRLEKIDNTMAKGRRNYTLFLRYLDHVRLPQTSDLLQGKCVSVSLNYESCHYREMIHLVGMIRSAGGDYVLKSSLADVFATDPITTELADPPRSCTRSMYVKETIASGKKITVLTLDALLAMLGTDRETLSALPEQDISYLLDPNYGRKDT